MAEASLSIEPVPAFADNYLWLLARDGQAAVVDPGDAAAIEAALAARNLRLAQILVTHHHPDHVGGVAALAAAHGARVYGPAGEAIPAREVALAEGDRVDVLGHPFVVLDVPGHTAGHIAYYSEPLAALFCGDTLFAGGCGRLLGGIAAQLHASLQRLAGLPAATRVYCAHEYTLANLRFALAVEPDNTALRTRAQHCSARRARGEPTVPSTIEDERATNPFLRTHVPAVQRAAQAHDAAAAAGAGATFAVLRAWKNVF
jgi:hydroxyacylglutathione hydrolase